MDISDVEPDAGPSCNKENLSPPKKRPRTAMSASEKTMILNAYKYTHKNWPKEQYWSVTDCESKTAEILGVSAVTVRRIVKENKKGHEFTSPKKTGPKMKLINKLDEFDLSAIRRKVHQFFYRNEVPTVKKIVQVVNDDPDLPNFSMSTMLSIIKRLNFKYATRKRNSCLIDRQDIILWRKRYLFSIKQYRREGKFIYYQDETWINEGHTVKKTWIDTTIETPRQAFLEGLTTGLKPLTGKGRRLIISHIGSEEGFVNGGLLMFESKKNTDDYHKEMNAEHFEEWLRGILPKLKPNSVLVFDNAPYHSRKLEKTPTMAWRKAEIQEWFQSKNISYETSMVKAQLLELVNKVKSPFSKLAVDELAAEHGVTVLRLPPYHCELNPIEMVWAQVKGHVARNNTTFKMEDIKKLFHEGLNTVTSEKWSSCINHIIKEEDRMCQLDGLIDDAIDRFIIHVNSDSEESESESSGEE